MKKNFLLSDEWAPLFFDLPDDKAGVLIKAAFAFHAGLPVEIEDHVLSAVFGMIKSKIEENDRMYEETCQKRAEAGAKGGRPRKDEKQEKAKETICFSEKPNESNWFLEKANESKQKQSKAKKAEYDIEYDSEYENEYESESVYESDINTSCSELSVKPSEPEADVEAILLNDGTEWRPSVSMYEEYTRLYPAIDIHTGFRQMRAWCLANPARRKTKNGVKRFVNNWLSKAQDRARGQTANTLGIDWSAV